MVSCHWSMWSCAVDHMTVDVCTGFNTTIPESVVLRLLVIGSIYLGIMFGINTIQTNEFDVP